MRLQPGLLGELLRQLKARGAIGAPPTPPDRFMPQGDPAVKTAAGPITMADLNAGIIQYTGAAATLTLPAGDVMDGGALSVLPVDRAFEFVVINTGTGAATLAAGTGLAAVGSRVVATGASARFRVRKTAPNAFTVYRVG